MRYDALVIGGGPAGSSAALLLARAGFAVAVLEKSEFPRRKVCGEFVSAATLSLLQELGVSDAFLAEAGPEVRRVGLFAANSVVIAPMPRLADSGAHWGRALSRERLDTLLLARAQQQGARIWQPFKAVELARDGDAWQCTAMHARTRELQRVQARIVIAGNGSWEAGPLPMRQERKPHDADLLGFKAHFTGSDLAQDLMPLLVFPGGYGGMVTSSSRRVSLSCCIRRDRLRQVRGQWRALSAGEAVLAHIADSCSGVRDVLSRARREGEWLSAGPIRPGIRVRAADRILRIGNAAGEAHPIVAEGIGMAIQSAWLLSHQLLAVRAEAGSDEALVSAAREYARAWRRHFSVRVHAAALFAQLALRPVSARVLLPLFETVPSLLTLGAGLSGKVRPLEGSARPFTQMEGKFFS